MQTKLKHSIKRGKLVIPAGTMLDFALEDSRYAMYRGAKIDIYSIPTAAFEMEPVANNAVNPESDIVSFDALEPGMLGSDANGASVRILGKAAGQAGYDALVTQFGNTSDMSFDQLTNGFDEDEIAGLQFVAYSNADGETLVDLYGVNNVIVSEVNAATESDMSSVKPFEDVDPTDEVTDKSGNKFTVLGKGIGKVWFEKTVEAYSLDESFDNFESMLEEGETGDDIEFVLVKDGQGVMSIQCYCPENGVSAANDVEDNADPAIEAIMADAKRRWENGGAELYKRLQEKMAAVESICIAESDETIRQNLEHELSENNIEYTVNDDSIVIEDTDDNVEFLTGIAPIYASVKAGLAEASIEAVTSFIRH